MKKLLHCAVFHRDCLSLTTASFAQDGGAPQRRTTPRRPIQGQEAKKKAAKKADKKTDDKMRRRQMKYRWVGFAVMPRLLPGLCFRVGTALP